MKLAVAVAIIIAGCSRDPEPASAPLPIIAVAAPKPPPSRAPSAQPAAQDPCNVRATVEHFAAKTTRFWLDDEHAARAEAGFVDAITAELAVTDTVADAAKQLAGRVTAALKARDYAALSKLIGKSGLCLRASKGAACRWMDARELAHCGHGRRQAWAMDTGADTLPRFDCADAFAKIFYNRDYAKATPKVNCFPEPGRGNNTSSILTDEVGTVTYVELYDEDDRGMWGALWLHLAYDDVDLKLVGLTSEYWGI
ncbi:MAG TPA: hypothetical protein VH143_12665 [Kofleriaceae bacterium]|jgi:hypothetical protein|nr:hypothetical protein [Kofleriaceae bacterium]